MILARRVRRNKPNQILTENGWVDVSTFGDPPPEDYVEPDMTAFGDLVCDCGFEAKTAGGLTTHQRTHEEEE